MLFRKLLFILPMVLSAKFSFAQTLTGTWEGNLGTEQFLQINIIQAGDKLCGYTWDYIFMNQNDHCKAYFTGSFDKKEKVWIIDGISFMENSGTHELMRLKLKLYPGEEAPILRGYLRDSLTSSSRKGEISALYLLRVAEQPDSMTQQMRDCEAENNPAEPKVIVPTVTEVRLNPIIDSALTKRKVLLHGVKKMLPLRIKKIILPAVRPVKPEVLLTPPPPPPPVVPESKEPSITDSSAKEKLLPPAIKKVIPPGRSGKKNVPAKTSDVSKNPVTPAPVVAAPPKQDTVKIIPKHDTAIQKPVPLPPEIAARKNKQIGRIIVQDKKITLNVYDNGTVDGDTVSIFYNGRLLVDHQRLTEKPITIDLTLDENTKLHSIVLFAENLGSIPPNTALVIFTTPSGKRYELYSSATLKQNAEIIFEYKAE